MTLEELDDALTKVFGLDFTKEECRGVRDRILTLHGNFLLNSRKTICAKCWLRENKGCSHSCQYYTESTDPIEVSKEYLTNRNDVSIFPFICMFVIPLYEKETGERGTIQKLSVEYRKRWKKEHGDSKSQNYI